MFSVIVATMTVIALGFVAAWWLRPDIRDLMEDPKYKFDRWGRECSRGLPLPAGNFRCERRRQAVYSTQEHDQ
jgi:hypothetical protein